MLKEININKHTAIMSSAISANEDTCCPLSLWCLQCCWEHSAGCRTYWVCLQHCATVVTSNGVTVCAASFHLPSVSTANTNAVQHPTPHQHSQLLWYPRCCFLSPVSWQPLFTATAQSSFVSFQACQQTTIIKSKFLFSTVTSFWPHQTPVQNIQRNTQHYVTVSQY
jgi:hypothetical protein